MAARANRAFSRDTSKESSIYGRLGSVGLNDILQLLGLMSRTATVTITRGGRQGKIFVETGKVLHARAGDVSGEDAILRLVNWTDGDFVIEEGIDEPITPTISKSVDAVMLNVLTQLDESKRSGQPLFTPFPSLDKIRSEDLPSLEQRVRSARVSRLPAPRHRPRRLPAVLSAVGLLLGSAVGFLAHRTLVVRAGDLPDVGAQAAAAAAAPAPGQAGASAMSPSSDELGTAQEVLRAATTDDGDIDTVSLLEARGVSLEAPAPAPAPTPATPETPDPASEPRAPAAPGSLLVVAEPWGRISVDGKEIGETPLPAFPLAAGAHELVLSNPGFVGDIHDRIAVEPGQTLTVSYSFLDTGKLRILVTPWADVYIDEKHVGQTPLDELDVTVGRHEIVLRHPSLGERREVVEVIRERSVVVDVEMP